MVTFQSVSCMQTSRSGCSNLVVFSTIPIPHDHQMFPLHSRMQIQCNPWVLLNEMVIIVLDHVALVSNLVNIMLADTV